ncbi:DUF262 domain-containing protein [Xanthomonas hortorum]|uniref:GmrSD restriction endonucleases N-terminal domain-containing protein n=2 Tax=Xanthomonas hortorum TaxID=56454 RepID=A0A6V7BLL0_9XANT|nr:DUF262 domain-containing protein [Xanthomonas hortorum]MCC4626355.1 DUF262 domain-containing protein [Xanthomonas campestris pv. nigromaculans]APP78429.1 hypothetical protein BJD10_00765 [Xanthomonas hortorum pv. gardneri]EGD17535.1 Protein of unknown function DUF262 [Xanthomonas hortorum ATCC 19865]MCC8500239.1 DUF262 domain-containing protein [Xanthomonas hortorum pv. gardneri]MCC8509686.1 DUF262 domain-containing protein [Xanthomonas hortorum pv. gardneri]
MKVEEAKYSIAEIRGWFIDKVVSVNKDYQRSSGLWPASAKSYFIDSILRDFPFPKVYFHERLDKALKKPHREIVDGQQRLTTIFDFAEEKFALGKNAGEFAGMRLSDLPQELQDEFWSYTVSVDVIRNADRANILQMFRRMNAFTLPLNAAEKRHSEFYGDFKDWVNRTLDKYGSILVDWKVFTSRQIVRMVDAEFIADVALAAKEGLVSTSPKKLTKIYADYENSNGSLAELDDKVWGALDVVRQQLSGIQGSYAVKPHIFHSLLCALMHNKFGLPDVAVKTGIQPSGIWLDNPQRAVAQIRELVEAFETRSVDKYSEFVNAAAEGGNRAPQRQIRVKWLCAALQSELP